MCVCSILTPAALPVWLQHPGHAAADRSSCFAGADLLTASIDLLAPVWFYENVTGPVRKIPEKNRNVTDWRRIFLGRIFVSSEFGGQHSCPERVS